MRGNRNTELGSGTTPRANTDDLLRYVPLSAEAKPGSSDQEPQQKSGLRKFFRAMGFVVGALVALFGGLIVYVLITTTSEEWAEIAARRTQTKSEQLQAAEREQTVKAEDADSSSNLQANVVNEANAGVSAIEKMAVVFKGGFTKDQIERETSTVLRLFGMPLTEDNYSELGSVVVALRKTVEPNTEMDILRCMKAAKREAYNVNLKMPESAAICATGIAIGLQ